MAFRTFNKDRNSRILLHVYVIISCAENARFHIGECWGEYPAKSDPDRRGGFLGLEP